jgi:hypothetical protein
MKTKIEEKKLPKITQISWKCDPTVSPGVYFIRPIAERHLKLQDAEICCKEDSVVCKMIEASPMLLDALMQCPICDEPYYTPLRKWFDKIAYPAIIKAGGMTI